MPYKYAYIIGCLFVSLFWLLIFLKRKDLRREMLWASFWGLPFGLIDFFLAPTYWNLDSLFGLIRKYGVGIESFIFFFIMTGLASVIYEFIWKEKPVKLARAGRFRFWLIFLILPAYAAMSILFPLKAIYNLMIVGAAGTVVIAYWRKDLRKQIFASAFIFTLLYFGVFVLVNLIFKGWVGYFYNLNNTWGILVLGIPLEELGVAFFAGAFWSAIYEYTKDYRGRKIC
jgi:hypothetical protein